MSVYNFVDFRDVTKVFESEISKLIEAESKVNSMINQIVNKGAGVESIKLSPSEDSLGEQMKREGNCGAKTPAGIAAELDYMDFTYVMPIKHVSIIANLYEQNMAKFDDRGFFAIVSHQT